jgi:hypothetical protein
MKRINSLVLLLAVLFAATSCQKEEGPEPIKSVGISFAKDGDMFDLNTQERTATVDILVNADITKEQLEQRLKLKHDSETAVEGVDYRIKSTTFSENPLKATLEIEVLPSLARTTQVVEISFDQSMQPIAIGNIGTYTLTIAPYSPVRTWHEDKAYHAPFVYNLNKETGAWQNVGGHFSTVPEDDAAVLGFENNYVAESGVPLFNMHRIYSAEIGSTNIKTARINAPKVLEFIPAEAGSKRGTVRVIPQDVTVSRTDASTFKIGISGEGTYDEESGLIDLVVDFNETAIGGPAKVSHTYKMSNVKLTF